MIQNPFWKWPRNLYCFCGSGKKFKKCHLPQLGREVSKEEFEVLKPEFDRILQYVTDFKAKGRSYRLKEPIL